VKEYLLVPLPPFLRVEPGSAKENFCLDRVDSGATGVAPAMPGRVLCALLTGEKGKKVGVAGGAASMSTSWPLFARCACSGAGVEKELLREEEEEEEEEEEAEAPPKEVST